jgi:nucleotidyltransferase/DNA polymerase involved in DNA repair
MEACVDTSALSAVNASPAWAIRVARPPSDGFRMAEELRGVPKPALQTVFGRSLGLRIWELARGTSAKAGVSSANQISDADLSMGMVEYLAQQAADTLRARRRQANALKLTITFADGRSTTTRMRLLDPTSVAKEIACASRVLLNQFPASAVQSIDLAVAT